MEQVKLFFLALQFFTRIPVRGRLAQWVGYSPERLSQATRFFPLIGALLAMAMSVVYVLSVLVLPQAPAVILTIAFGVWLTGAFHEDGWIDFCDAFGGHRDRAQTLLIMQDSRIGSYGAVAIVLLMALKVEALVALDPSWVAVALLGAHVFSRLCAVFVMQTLPYAKPDDESKSKPIAVNLRWMDTVVAALFGAVLMGVAVFLADAWRPFAWGSALAGLGMFSLRHMMKRRLGGYTGDGLGAVQQVSEVLFFLGLLIALGTDHVDLTFDSAS
jgi:adenosylcobinamide-GDP ribazoletransferase